MDSSANIGTSIGVMNMLYQYETEADERFHQLGGGEAHGKFLQTTNIKDGGSHLDGKRIDD